MSDLKPAGTKIKLGQKAYGMRFTLNAIEDIQDRFNIPISELGDLFRNSNNQIANLRAVLTILINEDIDCMNDEGGEKLQHVEERFVGRHIDASNISAFMNQVLASFTMSIPKSDNDIDPEDDSDPNPVSE